MQWHTLMLLPLVALLAGWATAMPASPQALGLVESRLQMDARARVVDGNPLPLRFVNHQFDVHVYDTLAFYVEYNGDGFLSDHYRSTRSPFCADAIPRERWPLAGYIGVRNWRGPAKLRWTSQDGEEHTPDIDVSRLSADGLTLYDVADNELPAGMYHQGIGTDSEIPLDMENRTVRVYQRARMSTAGVQVPGNGYSHCRRDLFLVAEFHR